MCYVNGFHGFVTGSMRISNCSLADDITLLENEEDLKQLLKGFLRERLRSKYIPLHCENQDSQSKL